MVLEDQHHSSRRKKCSTSHRNAKFPLATTSMDQDYHNTDHRSPLWRDTSDINNLLALDSFDVTNDPSFGGLLFSRLEGPAYFSTNDPLSPLPALLPATSMTNERHDDDQDPFFDLTGSTETDTFVLTLSGSDSDGEMQPDVFRANKRSRSIYETKHHPQPECNLTDSEKAAFSNVNTTPSPRTAEDTSTLPANVNQTESTEGSPAKLLHRSPIVEEKNKKGKVEPIIHTEKTTDTIHDEISTHARLPRPSASLKSDRDSKNLLLELSKGSSDRQHPLSNDSDGSSRSMKGRFKVEPKETKGENMSKKRRYVRSAVASKKSGSAQPIVDSQTLVPSQAEYNIAAGSKRSIVALETWYHRLRELNQYKLEHGNTNVPQKYKRNPQLGVWVNKQRCTRESLSTHKRNSLDKIKFDWGKKKGVLAWNQRYEELKLYKQNHGDCLVPTKCHQYPSLGRWVSTQRTQYKHFMSGKKSPMTQELIDRLNELEFVWSMT